MKNKLFKFLPALTMLSVLSGAAVAANKEVSIAYQTVVEPSKIAQADGEYEKQTGWKINWRKFESGGEVITALASGDIQIAYLGSSGLAAAATREAPLETIFIAAEIGDAEALVVRNGSGIKKPQDLIGKKVAVPFVSTTHYSLLAALKHWRIDPKKVQILNLRPNEITAAWLRGDIDAAYVWDPALGKVKESGAVLTHSAEVAKWGAPTFDAWIVRKDFARAHPDFVTAFVRITGQANAEYRKNGKSWTADSPQVEKIARLTGASKTDIPSVLRGSLFPTLDEQASTRLLAGGTVKAISDTSQFLKEQKKAERLLSDYRPYVNPLFVKQAAGQ